MENQVPIEVLILLSVSVVVVAVFRWFRLAHVLGYLFVGMLIGPYGLAWLNNGSTTQLLGELGVVFLMFAIGLEFSRAQLLRMRGAVFGLGGLQVALTSSLVMLAVTLMGLDLSVAFIAGGVLAMSSTAIVIKQLAEQLELNSRHGRLSISILLFQDLAVIPFLIVIPALGTIGVSGEHQVMSSLIIMLGKGLAISIAMILAGYWVLRPLFHLIAAQRSTELFMLTVLSVALTAAWVTHEAGLSLTLGAFLAGMMLGETEFKHQIESDIRPFQDVFLALFFVTVGMLLDFSILIQYWYWIALLLVLLICIKVLIISFLARTMKHSPGVSVRTALILGHGGEFGFVMLAESLRYSLLDATFSQILLATVILSMMIAPFMIRYNGRLTRMILDVLAMRYSGEGGSTTEKIQASVAQLNDHVIICGYGWTGQNVGRFLEKEGYEFIALDLDPARVREARNAGVNVVYGDPSRGPVLEATGVDRARAMIITHTNTHSSLKILARVRALRKDFPVLVRTRDESELERLRQAGATEIIADTYEVSMMLSNHLFLLLGGNLSTVLKRTRLQHRERYKSLAGFFPGQENGQRELGKKGYKVLRTVVLDAEAAVIGQTLREVGLSRFNVEITAIKRHGIRATDPQPDVVFKQEDVLVLFGKHKELLLAEQLLLKG